MNIYLAIKHIHPTFTDNDFMVIDENQGEGPYIRWHNKEIPQPTQAELETAWIEVEKLQQAEAIKLQKKADIEKVATLTDQLNLIESVLDTITSPNPDQAIIDGAKAKFNDIQTILNN